MPNFDDKSVERISKTVVGFEKQKQQVVPGKRFEFVGGSGGGASQMFLVDEIIPARVGDTASRVRLFPVSMELNGDLTVDDSLPINDKPYVYNLRSSPIFPPNTNTCDPGNTTDDLYCLAVDVGGKWVITELFLNMEAMQVGSNFGFSADGSQLQMQKKTIYVFGDPSACDPDGIDVSPCL